MVYTNRGRSTEKGFVPAQISDNANVVLETRYLLKDTDGNLKETPDELFRRVAKAVAEAGRYYDETKEDIEKNEQRFYKLMASLDFLPNSPTLMNAGLKGTLSACFVLPLTDSMEGIMAAAHDAAMVQKFGGGTGFSLSEIRPKNSPIKTTHGKACGPIAVLKHLSSVSTLVTQGGKRDGANMAVLDIHHPDILEFIECKTLEGSIHNFNISVGASEEFMQAVKNDTDYPLRQRESQNGETKMVEVKRLRARDVFRKIVDGAWKNGEPGMIFLDEVNKSSPVLHVGEITATNPCGEQPLLPNESCNLGSIDVGKFVLKNSQNSSFDWERLEETIRLSIRFLDNIIDANQYALKSIEDMTKSTRKLGLGVMGFADALVSMDIPYESDEGIELGRKLMQFFDKVSFDESCKLADERGPFPAWVGSEFQKKGTNIRNACRLTVAPTGTISMIAGASSGIEPLFSLAFRKQNILSGKTLYYVNEAFEQAAKDGGFYSEDLMSFLGEGGSLQERDDVPKRVKKLFKTSPDISPKNHVLMQAAFQESTDAAISKTINFPNKATVEDVEESYLLAWQTKCKGITVYRAGSRDLEVLTTGHSSSKEPENQKKNTSNSEANESKLVPHNRPISLAGITQRVRTGRGNIYVTINQTETGEPFEIFTAHGKAGGNDAAMAEAVSRLVSLALRSGIPTKVITAQIRHIADEPVWDNGVQICSVPDAIAHALDVVVEGLPSDPYSIQHKMLDTDKTTVKKRQNVVSCPDCFGHLAHEEGCLKCHSCGFSKC